MKRLANGAQLAAGRISQALPPGTTAAQVEAMVATEAVSIASKYADSAKVSKADQTVIAGMISGELGQIVPAGRIVASLPAAAQDAANSFIANVKTALAAQPVLPSAALAPTLASVATTTVTDDVR